MLGAHIPLTLGSIQTNRRLLRGKVLTEGEYLRVEQAYIDSATAFLREGGIDSLTVEGIENHKGLTLEFGEGSSLSLEAIADVIRQMLREELWCRLENEGGFVHIGWDYYMYIGVPRRCPKAELLAEGMGLYAELFSSPYKKCVED